MNDTATLHRPSPARPRRGGRPVFVQRYWAFLSYSHKDGEVAGWLHSSLERFRVPKKMVGRGTPFGLVPARLAPVFRDQHDLAAGDDLREDIKDALASSRFLIVLCSPAAVSSRWVDEEIRLFKQLRPDGEVLAAIIAGEPWAAEMPGREAEECFPLALKQEFDEAGQPTGERAEPIAADLRAERDGRQLGLQKLIAGMLDVGLDDLVQRDAQRRQRRMLALTGASVAGMIVTSGLAVMAVQARDEARDQRREAEGLVGFMLGDLKDKLEPVGRLDALDAVGAKVLAYYERQNKGDLSDEALAQRSKALTLMGDIAQRRGEIQGALRLYGEGLDGTAEALRRDPDNPQRLFDHAQNVFWIGELARQLGRRDRAEAAFRQYKELADRMVELEPSNPKWRMEVQYAASNLGIVLYQGRRYREAADEFRRARSGAEVFVQRKPANTEYRTMLLETLAWLADSQLGLGQLAEAVATRRRQLTLIEASLHRDPRNAPLLQREVPARRSLGRILAMRGELDTGVAEVRRGVEVAERLVRSEPDNMIWLQLAAGAQLDLGGLLQAGGDVQAAAEQVRAGCAKVSRLERRDGRERDFQTLQADCLMRRARLALAGSESSEALVWAGQALAAAQSRSAGDPVERAFLLASVRRLIGDVHAAAGNRRAALGAWREALAGWPSTNEHPLRKAIHADLLRKVGLTTQARPLEKDLRASGFRLIV